MSTPRTLRRSVRLLSAFRYEQTDPDRFYDMIASDAVTYVGDHVGLRGARVVDVGGGAGYFTKAFRAAGSVCFVVEPSAAELTWRGAAPDGALLGDGYSLPFRTGSADLVVSSNVLEHVARPYDMIDELARVARPGGHVWLSYTNWYGPWGGHETSPWHLAGGHWASRRYEARYGHPPKNLLGESLFRVHVGTTLRYVNNHPALEVVQAIPRYHPGFAKGILKVPGVRELVTWNLELLMRRRPVR
ncbi:MAG: class I SAM-dependent methyltransferase [Acidimicrobiales bacterium]